MEIIILSEGRIYQVDDNIYTLADLSQALKRVANEKERNRKKALKYYHRTKPDLPGKDDAPADSVDLPGKDDAPADSVDLPGKDDVQPFRTDHRGLIFPTTDGNGRLLTYNGRPWVPIQIPKLS